MSKLNMKNNFLVLNSLLGVTFLLASCGKPTVSIQTQNIEVTAMKEVPPQNLTLLNNRFFLWKKDMSASDVQMALGISDKLDEADDYRKFQIKKDYPADYELSQQYEYPKVQQSLRKLNKQVASLTSEIENSKKEMTKLQEELKRGGADEKKAQEIREKLASLEHSLKLNTEKLDQVQGELLKTTALFQKLDRFKKLQEKFDSEVVKQTDLLKTVTEMGKSFPQAIYFEFDAKGNPQVRIEKWDVPDDDGPSADQDRDFTSISDPNGNLPNIKNVRYSIKGGVWEFDVVTSPEDMRLPPKVTYSFRVALTKYNDKHGRFIFSGDFNRTEAGMTRRGSAKLVDRNN